MYGDLFTIHRERAPGASQCAKRRQSQVDSPGSRQPVDGPPALSLFIPIVEAAQSRSLRDPIASNRPIARSVSTSRIAMDTYRLPTHGYYSGFSSAHAVENL